MSQIDPQRENRLKRIVEEQPYPLLFATVSGAHLYGFASADSDYDLRGVHLLPARDMLGLFKPRETIEASNDPAKEGGFELDLVTHDPRKFFLLLLKRNGYVLEQLYLPLVVHAMPEHEELKAIARGCITRHHVHHYLGFARTQWKLFAQESPSRVKPLLYVFRVLLTGIHLMRAGEVEANLVRLNEQFKLSYLDDLIAMKVHGSEKQTLDAADVTFYEEEAQRLEAVLRKASEESDLPGAPTAKAALSDLLLRLRGVEA